MRPRSTARAVRPAGPRPALALQAWLHARRRLVCTFCHLGRRVPADVVHKAALLPLRKPAAVHLLH
eukprot:2108538-Prymnesium_polylepis.1